MKKSIVLTMVGACVTCALPHEASAQQDAMQPTPILEAFGCTFKGNNDMDDFRAVTARWNAWADRHNVKDYSAFILTPYLYSAQLTYDLVWLGGWPSGAAMGAGEALWFAEGQDLQADFDAVSDCTVHQQFAEFVIRRPQGPPPERNGLAMFRDCEMKPGRAVSEAITALQQWTAYAAEKGDDVFTAMLFTLAGESDEADYDFKVLDGFASAQAYGAHTDMYTGGGFLRADELLGPVMECDSPRMYVLNRARLAAQPQ
jgi:hypothetical protein